MHQIAVSLQKKHGFGIPLVKLSNISTYFLIFPFVCPLFDQNLDQ